MEKDLISVIIPSYNCARWLPRCLDSLLGQTYRNLEIVVVDDGSTDNTREILSSYIQRHTNVKLICKSNGGVTSARLRGVAESSGQWIGFVDADDEVESHMYAHLLDNAETHQADISHCGYQVIYPDGNVEYLHNTGMLRRQSRETALRDLLEDKIMDAGLCSKLFRRELFAGLAEKMDLTIRNNEDFLMNYYLFEQAEKAVFEDICPYHYLIRQGSASRRKLNEHMIFDPIRVRQILLDHCQPELKDDVQRSLARMCLVSYRQLVMQPRKEYSMERSKVRNLIREQRSNDHVLPVRNKWLVRLISTAPWIFDGLFWIFAHLTGMGKE